MNNQFRHHPPEDRRLPHPVRNALETAVLHELERREAEVAYVKTESGHELDFHARMADSTERLLQVSVDIDDPSTFERELRALTKSAEALPHATLHLITLACPAGRTDIPDGVEILESSDWLRQ